MAQANDSNDARERIIREATRLFGEHGAKATSLQSIADAVGIRKPSLLYHFNSKDELYQAVIGSLLDGWKDDIPRLLEAATSEHDRFSSTITALVEFFMEDRNRARLVLREVLDNPYLVRMLLEEHLAPFSKLVTDYIRLGQQIGVCKPEVDPEAYVIQVVMMAIGTVAGGDVLSALTGARPDESLNTMINELVRIAREALFVKPSHGGAPPAR